jgi:hypothetical protein
MFNKKLCFPCTKTNQIQFIVQLKKTRKNRYYKKIDKKLFLISGNLSQSAHHNLKRQHTNVR